MRPVDDLLDFQINQHNDMRSNGTNSKLYNEYVVACKIRVARDLFALLLVRYVIVHVQSGEKSVLEVKFDKSVL